MVSFKKKCMLSKPPSFEHFEKLNHVYKFQKALYGIKQAPRVWYERLSKIFMDKGFSRGNVDTTLFLKKNKHYLWCKYMLMISFLVLLIKNYVSALLKKCRMSLK